MDAFLSFEGRIEAVEWGRATYTVLILPDDVAAALHAEGAKRVEGEINDYPVNLRLSKADAIPGIFLWTGKSLLEAAGISPDALVEVRLRKADPNHVETPVDVTEALMKANVMAWWETLTPGKKRSLLHSISTAKRQETRARRIVALAESLT